MNELANSAPAVEVPPVEVPPISERDAFAMDLGDLKKAAFDPQPAPTAQPQTDPQPQTAPEPYTVEQGPDGVQVRLSPEYGGEVYKGKDLNEVVAKLAKSKADTNAYVKQLKTQMGQPQAQPQPFLDPAMPQSPEDEQRAQQEAAEFLRTALLTSELKRQLVTEALNNDPRVHQITSTVQEFTAHNMAFEFHRRCPDYVDLPEQTKALEQALGNLDHPATVDDLEMAWARVVYKTPQLRYVPPSSTPASRPPVMPSAGAPQGGGDQSAWSMDLNDLKKAAGLG